LLAYRIPRTPAGFIRALVPSNTVEADTAYSQNSPVWRHTSVHKRFLREDLEKTVSELKQTLESGLRQASSDPIALQDPEYRLRSTLHEMLGAGEGSKQMTPIVVCVVGDIEEDRALSVLQSAFRSGKSAPKIPSVSLNVKEREKVVRIPGKAQSQFGYAVPAPPPSQTESLPYRILSYILTHGYEGRLGKEMIGNQGLIYYISSEYLSDGRTSWISIGFGVNPDKLDAAGSEFRKIIQALKTNPPTEQELAEAKEHLIGRRQTAYQSNEELSAFFVREWMEQGRIVGHLEFEKRVRAVTLEQLHRIVPEFLNGVIAIIDTK
jgi:hypothetical protein